MSVFDDYSTSHVVDGYGVYYDSTYKRGYYLNQWSLIESKLLRDIFSRYVFSMSQTKILDFACGTGRIASFLADDLHMHVDGYDISSEMLGVAKSRGGACNYFCESIETARSSGYDVVTAFRFFLNAEDDLRRFALSNLYRVLSVNGLLVVNIHVSNISPLGLAYRFRNFLLGRTVAKTCGRSEAIHFLEDSGFQVVEVIDYSFVPRVGRFTDALSPKLFLLFDKFAKFLRVVPSQSFILVAKKLVV